MKRVKGTVLVNSVKLIRADKSGIYDQYLTEEDKAIISRRISPAVWYPYETFKHCFKAIFEVAAKKDLDQVRKYSRFAGEMMITDIYKDTLKPGDPLSHLRKIPIYILTFYDFGQAEVVVEKPNQVLVRLIDYDPDFAPFYYMLAGVFECIAELCGGQNVRCEFVTKSWEDKSNTTSYLISWE